MRGAAATLALFALAVTTPRAHGQDLEPRAYANTPIGMNFVLLGYAYSEGGVTTDPSIPLTNADIGLRMLASMPVSPRIRAHSIIAVKGDGPKEEGDDGVVAYRSAHLDEAVSELVVRWDHSCQGQPEVIEEIRRILLEHAATPGDRRP